ncbi:histidine kinase [Rhodotorula toruloides]|uniref:histidine kinase n=1 Tax=Rhodotorula toruloides TaxID=5286 RepID=A0A511KR14_RHOTO|nr:histidine kinase [Rhodotorula toruloides]
MLSGQQAPSQDTANLLSDLVPRQLVDYLSDLPLPACIFAHSQLAYPTNTHPHALPPTLQPPVFQNAALDSLLAQRSATPALGSVLGDAGTFGGTVARVRKVEFPDAMTAKTRQRLRDWLANGAKVASAPPAPAPARTMSPSPLRPVGTSRSRPSSPLSRPPPAPRRSSSSSSSSTSTTRQISLQLHRTISMSKLRWRATVYDDYTVLTLLPALEVAQGRSMSFEQSTNGANRTVRIDEEDESPTQARFSSAQTTMPKRDSHDGAKVTSPIAAVFPLASRPRSDSVAQRTRDVEMLGEIEVLSDKAMDATSLQGLAWSAWNLPVGLFRADTDFRLTQTNPMWRKLCGLPEGHTNDAWPSRIHPDDRARVVQHYIDIVEKLPRERDEYEFRWLPDSQGQEQWCVCVLSPVLRSNGDLSGYLGVLTNINKHKALESASERREAQLQTELAILSDTCAVGLSRHELDGTFISVNPAWYEITGVDPSQPVETWRDRIHPADQETLFKAWDRALEHRENLMMQFRWQTGRVSLVQVVLNHREKEQATGWIGSIIDITAQARAEEAILNLSKEREAMAKAEANESEERRKVAVEEKRQQELLIDVTSHEIRNPISAILQNSDFTRSSLQSLRETFLLLQSRNALPPELDGQLLHDLEEDIEALDAITECGLAQERIANDILGLAQIQLSKYSVTPIYFDLATSLRNICRMFKSECRTKGIELRLVTGSSLARLGSRARVFADPARLTQIIVNLLSNAIRFTAKSQVRIVTLRVEVSAVPPEPDAPLIPPHETEYHIEEKRPIHLFFSVEDTGPGMTEEETSRLFAKFMQASPFTHTTWGGSGLGLWIARNLCELQGGRIEVASTVGKGSIFRCFITAGSVEAGPTADDRALAVLEGITGPNAERGQTPKMFLRQGERDEKPLSGLTVLCCEDNQINRTVLRRQLQKEGCSEVLLAVDGKEGLDILNDRPAGHVDCILMDIEMPVMDGLAATRAIRQAEHEGTRGGHQHIIGLTGNARSAQRHAALEAGMDAVVTKPYKFAPYPAATPPRPL